MPINENFADSIGKRGELGEVLGLGELCSSETTKWSTWCRFIQGVTRLTNDDRRESAREKAEQWFEAIITIEKPNCTIKMSTSEN